MNEEMKKYLKDEISVFEDMTMKFVNDTIDMKTYKGFSGGYGCYAQRGKNGFMLRLRMNQGVITKQKLTFLIQTLQHYKINKLHITTCQTCQLHNLLPQDVGTIMRSAIDYDIVTRGGGGDFPRNVMCSPLSGVDPKEYFDVSPYAKCVGEHFLSNIHTYHLPRKLKVSFSNQEADETHATFRDLGFCANADGTFDVYIAGGLGNNPKMGILVEEHMDPTHVLYSVEAMVRTFQKHGNYENRAKARTRYMQESLGVDGLKNAYLEELASVKKENLTLSNMNAISIHKTGDGELDHPMCIKQKQPGLYALHIHPRGGDISLDRLLQVAERILPMPDVEMRISPQQDLYIVHLTAKEATTLLTLFPEGASTLFERSVACIGSSICQVGIRDSQALLQHILKACDPYHFKDGILPRLHISGCNSSCGTHQIAGIGFQGSVKLVDKQPMNGFSISIFGKDGRRDAHFGEVCGVMLENEIPNFLIELGLMIQIENTTYYEFIEKHRETFQKLIAMYCA